MNKWFLFNNPETNENELDFTQLTSSNNQIILDKDTENENNKKIRTIIKENIKLSADYGKDSDNDGNLESDEDDDPDENDAQDR